MKKRNLFVGAAGVLAAILVGYLIVGAPSGDGRRAAGGAEKKVSRKDDRPNVIFVVLDAVRADHLSVCGYGRPTSPALRRLVKEGASITCRAYSPGTWTHPSHASFFTGEEVHVHHADFSLSAPVDGGSAVQKSSLHPLDAQLPTLAEKMSARGYQTIAISGNPVVSKWAMTGLTRGFEDTWESRAFGDSYGRNFLAKAEAAVQKIDTARPVFFFANICDAHVPWLPIPPGLQWVPRRMGMTVLPEIPTNPFGKFFRKELLEDEKEQFLEHSVDLYDYAIFRANKVLQKVLALLSQMKIFEGDFRLIITSDHGEFLGEHELMIHGVYTYEPGVVVPLLYMDKKRTKIPFEGPISALAAHDLALLGRLPDKPRPVRTVGYPAPEKWLGGRHEVTMASQWSGDEKLTWKNGEYSHFDLKVDPSELSPLPLSEDHPLFGEFSEYADRIVESIDERKASPSWEMIEALRKLGYLK